MRITKKLSTDGFTIIELLVVITVIGILATISIVGFNSIQQDARNTQRSAQLTTVAESLEKYYSKNGEYPTCAAMTQASNTVVANVLPGLDPNNLTAPSGTAGTNSFQCTDPTAPAQFGYIGGLTTYTLKYLEEGSGSVKSIVARHTVIAAISCPDGFIPVPGSVTYGTSNFCVMKYEAKADDNGDGIGDTNHNTGGNTWPNDTHPIFVSRKLVSTANGYPVAKISQSVAIIDAATYTYNCPTGCHLITEAEWLTIAQNVLSVSSNWSTGSVGNGFIYSGNNDGVPGVLEADLSDSNGYYGTGNTAPSNQRRTLTLTNGEVIWDFAGNVMEWTSGQTTGVQPGDSDYDLREWTAITNPGTLSPNPNPATTGISGASGWNSSNGIGQIWSNSDDIVLRGFIRGGHAGDGSNAGVMNLDLGSSPSFSFLYIGFRVAK